MHTHNENLRNRLLPLLNGDYSLDPAGMISHLSKAREVLGKLATEVGAILDMVQKDLEHSDIYVQAEKANGYMLATLDFAEETLGAVRNSSSEGDLGSGISCKKLLNQEFNSDLRLVFDKNTARQRVHFRSLTAPFTLSLDFIAGYTLLVVKGSRRKSFSAADAETIAQDAQHCIRIESGKGTDSYQADLPVRDSDGNPLVPGQQYSLLLLARFTDEYKRLINNYQDWLSVPVPFTFGKTEAETPADLALDKIAEQHTGILQTIKVLCDKTIFTAEIINKLSNLIIRKKALNPLISDELIVRVTRAGKTANEAVASVLSVLSVDE